VDFVTPNATDFLAAFASAIILGIIAMRETKRTGQDGYGLALAGVIIGALVTVFVLLYFLFIFGLYASDWSYV